MTEYLNSGNANEAVNGVREMRAPKHFLPEMLSKVIILSLDRSDEDKEKASSLISLLKQEGIATSDNFMQVEHFPDSLRSLLFPFKFETNELTYVVYPSKAFLNVLDQCPKLEVDIPLVKSYLAQFAARAIISELVSISELAQPLESGTHFPLFLLCLQQLAKLQDREWLTELFQQSKVNMQKMLPGKTMLGFFFSYYIYRFLSTLSGFICQCDYLVQIMTSVTTDAHLKGVTMI